MVSLPIVPPRETTGSVRAAEADWIARQVDARSVGTIVFTGVAGSGKTWLARALQSRLVASGAISGTGKYAEGEAFSGFTPLFAALSELLDRAFAELYDPQTGIAALTEALGVKLEILMGAGLVVPGLHDGSPVKTLVDSHAGLVRINSAVLHLLGWIQGFGVRLVLMIDDWDRGSTEVRALVRMIAGMQSPQSLLLILTQRGGDTGPFDVPVLTHRVEPLPAHDALAMLAEALGDQALADSIGAMLVERMPTLPLDVVGMATAIQHGGVATRGASGWIIDPAKLGALVPDAEGQIARLDPNSRELAAGLALWGDAAPWEAIIPLFEDAETVARELETRGIASIRDGRIVFSHDRLRQAAIASSTELQRCALAERMATRLASSGRSGEVERSALQLRLIAGVEGADPILWRDRFADGAQAARARGDVASAATFAEAALTLHRRRPAPDIAAQRLILRESLLAAASRESPETEARARSLIATARSPDEVLEDYETSALALRSAGQADAAWRLACEGLRQGGITPPSDQPRLSVIVSALRWRWEQRRGSSPSEIEEGGEDVFTTFAATAGSLAYHRDPRAAAVIAFRASARAGRHARKSGYWHAVDAFLYSMMGAYRHAADAGRRAFEVLGEQRVLRAATLYNGLYFGMLWRQPLGSLRGHCREVTRLAEAEGDGVYASYGLWNHVMIGWRTGTELPALLDDARGALLGLRRINSGVFVDQMTDVVALLERLVSDRDLPAADWSLLPTRNIVIDLELSNLAGDWPRTVRRAAALRAFRRNFDSHTGGIVWRFHESLARLRCGLPARRRDLAMIRGAARLNPEDHAPKVTLLRAEDLRRRGRTEAALALYRQAVEEAEASSSKLDAGLTAECAAHAAREAGRGHDAAAYAERARAIWQAWGVLGKLHDGRDSQAVLSEVAATTAAAERADEAKSRLLAHVGHELRTPMQAMQAMLDLAADGATDLDVAEMRDVFASLTSVVDDLGIFGLLADDRGRQAGPVDLIDLVRSEVALWSGRGDVAFIEPARPLPLLDTVPNRVRQVVRNLLSNAVKYGAGSAVIARLSMEPSDQGQAITITVEDGGPGIPLTMLDTIFEPFDRGAFADEGDGIGLGLALARRIAERLGGGLTGANRDHGGARFTFTFPAAVAAPAASQQQAIEPAAVLLVDDSALIRRLIGAVVERCGHHVTEAGNAAAALAAWRAGAFDLLILDVGLPDASGLFVLQTVRLEGAGMLPILLLTATADPMVDEVVRADSRTALLRKPASMTDIAHAIASLLQRPGPEAPWEEDEPGLGPLYADACREIRAQARVQLDCAPNGLSAPLLHQLAGLAAQFGWLDVAQAAQAIEAAIVSGRPCDDARARLATAVARMS